MAGRTAGAALASRGTRCGGRDLPPAWLDAASACPTRGHHQRPVGLVAVVVEAVLDSKKAGRAARVVAGGQVFRLIHTVQLERFAEVVASTGDPR